MSRIPTSLKRSAARVTDTSSLTRVSKNHIPWQLPAKCTFSTRRPWSRSCLSTIQVLNCFTRIHGFIGFWWIAGYNRVIRKVYPKEESVGKFAQNWDYHVRRSKKDFWCSLKNHLNQALTMLSKITRSFSVVVYSFPWLSWNSPRLIHTFLHTRVLLSLSKPYII